jgi:hypothetical protein
MLTKDNCNLTQSSIERVKTFVDWFIRSDFVETLTSERDADFINEPERASRCSDAAEHGCDGKTHAEVIDDWRDAFTYWLRERAKDARRRCWRHCEEWPCFEAAVRAYFDSVEEWHEKNGSLEQEIG